MDDHPWPGLLAGRPAHPDPGHRPALSAAGLHRGLPGDVQRQPAFLPSLSRLLFNADCLALPVRRDKRELRRFLLGAPANILVRYRDPQSLAARVKAYLRSLRPGRWPDADALAGHFFMAPSTLRRKLSLEGQSYQALKDQVRRDLAIARLDAGAANFAELALELGFADGSAFHKAFKKWTGSTPGSTGRRSRRKPRRPNRQASCPKRSAVDRANAAQRHPRYVANGSGDRQPARIVQTAQAD